MNRFRYLVLCLALATVAAAQQPARKRPAAAGNTPADSMQRKLDAIQQNAAAQTPATTTLTEAEINAWFASRYAQLPKGVHTLRLAEQNGQVTGTAQVNLDEVKEGRSSMNPLMALFNGTHDVEVVATGGCRAGVATVHVQSVAIDGVDVPRVALEFFVDHYLKPKYPNVGIDSTFRPGYRIDSATIGQHALNIVQK